MNGWQAAAEIFKGIAAHARRILATVICPERVQREQELRNQTIALDNERKALENTELALRLVRNVDSKEQLEMAVTLLRSNSPVVERMLPTHETIPPATVMTSSRYSDRLMPIAD